MEWFGIVGTGGAWHGMVAFLPWCGLRFPALPLIPQQCGKTPGGGEVSLQLAKLALVEALLK